MGVNISLNTNASSVAMELMAAAQDMKTTATVRALNKMGQQVITAIPKGMRQVGYKLKAADVKKGLRLRRASPSELRVVITASGRPLPLIRYGARQTLKGVSVDVLNGRKVIAHAFISTMPSGHQGVFVREDGGRHKKVMRDGKARWTQLPIRELFGPAIPDGVANAQVQETLATLVQEKFPALLEHESAWLARSKGR